MIRYASGTYWPQTSARTDTTHTAFNGLAPAQTTSTGTGTTTLVRDALGHLAEHVTQNGQATWDLLDRLGSTVAGANGPAITQLSSYDDWGAQQFATTGWSAPENYTGETTDPTQGLNHYHARSYDPGTASWTTPDPWHGLLTQPQTLHRYAYTQNDPTTYVDINGNRIGDPSSYNRVTPAQAEKMRQVDNQTNQQVAQSVQKSREAAAAPTKPTKPKPTGPGSKTDTTPRHPPEQYVPGSARAWVLTWQFHSDIWGNLEFSLPWDGRVMFEIVNDGGGAIQLTLRAYMGQGSPHTMGYALRPQTNLNTGPIDPWGIYCAPATPCEHFKWTAEASPFDGHDGWPLPRLNTFPFLVKVYKWDWV